MSPDATTEFSSENYLKSVEYRVIHTTWGRIRIQIPQLLKTPEYQSKLRRLVESFDFVTHVRLNIAAESIIVNYTKQTISPMILQQQLAIAIQQAASPDISSIEAISTFLTPYEQEQIQEIKKWESKDLDLLSNITGKIFSPVNNIIDLLIPAVALEAALKAADTVTSQWQKDWGKLKQIAGLEDYCRLKQAKLEFCDQLAHRIESEAVTLAGIEGGATGLFEWVGEIADIPLSIGLSLQTIHRIGLCYGYSPQTQIEKRFAWAVLGIGTANTTEERKKALEVLHDLQHVLYRQTIDDTIENSVEESVFESTIDYIVKQAIVNLTEGYSGDTIPFIGVGLGVIVNRSVMSEVSVSARSAFQIRWLLENKKLSNF